jgi:hypothetical protein
MMISKPARACVQTWMISLLNTGSILFLAVTCRSQLFLGVNFGVHGCRATIDELRRQVGDALLSLDPQNYDDIFLLRFVLTWEKRGGIPKAVDAIKQTVRI